MSRVWERTMAASGGVAGCVGIGLSASAAHTASGPNLETAARFLLFHAPVMLCLPALIAAGIVAMGWGRAAGAAFVIGLVLFCGDLSCRALYGFALAPMAAPAGGLALLLAWLLVTIGGICGGRAN